MLKPNSISRGQQNTMAVNTEDVSRASDLKLWRFGDGKEIKLEFFCE